jgi:hypothetical protein
VNCWSGCSPNHQTRIPISVEIDEQDLHVSRLWRLQLRVDLSKDIATRDDTLTIHAYFSLADWAVKVRLFVRYSPAVGTGSWKCSAARLDHGQLPQRSAACELHSLPGPVRVIALSCDGSAGPECSQLSWANIAAVLIEFVPLWDHACLPARKSSS